MGKALTWVADYLWGKLEDRLEKYFKARADIKAIASEAGALKEELSRATTDAEYDAILGKIDNFASRLKL